MADIQLVTGGCRSGKSTYAEALAESLGMRRLYVATAPVTDAEMAARVARHQARRKDRGWVTIEETLDVAGILRRERAWDVILVECLTLWAANRQYEASKRDETFGEDASAAAAEELAAAARANPARQIIFVTNEVGWGIVPETPVARAYRDLLGRCNQTLAARADRVTLLVSGIPLRVK